MCKLAREASVAQSKLRPLVVSVGSRVCDQALAYSGKSTSYNAAEEISEGLLGTLVGEMNWVEFAM